VKLIFSTEAEQDAETIDTWWRQNRLDAPQLVTTDPWADMAPEERAELEESLEKGFRDIENGDVVDAREFLAELRAKHP